MPTLRTKLSAKKTSSPLLNALTDKLTLQPGQVVNMALKPYIALDCFVRKQGNNFLYGTLVQYAIIIELLCQKGYLPEKATAVEEVHQHLFQVFGRGNSTGEWFFEPAEYRALAKMLSIYSGQLELVNPKDLMQAHTGMMEMLMERLTRKDEPVAA